MKYGLVLKKSMAIALAVLIVVMMVPLSTLLALAGDSTPLVTYDTPAEAVNSVIGETKGDAMLDYSNATYAFGGSLYGAAWNTASDKAIRTYVENDGGWTMAYTDAASWGHLSNNSFIYYSNSDYSGAIGIRLSEASGYIKMSFVAPENGKYHLNPLGITAAGGKSMLLSKGNNGGTDLEHYNQTLTITKGSTGLFSKTLTLGDGYADAADDLPSDLTVELAKGESLDFTFTTSADWDITHLFVNFEMQLMERTAAKVESVSFPSSDYIVEKADTTLNISPVVFPSNAADKTVTYTVEDTDVLSVDNSGNVTPKAAGYTKVTATTNDGQKTAETLICVYDSTTASIYNVKDYYDAAVEAIGTVTENTTIDNTTTTPWQPAYKSGTGFVKTEDVTKELWGGSNFGLNSTPASAGSPLRNWGYVSQYMDSGRLVNVLNYGRAESPYDYGVALIFTAPQKGVYSFRSDSKVSITNGTITQINTYEQGKTVSVNFCLNGQKLTSVTLSAESSEVDFPVINAVSMEKDDVFTVEIETAVFEKAQVSVLPQAIWVYEKAPDKPVTGVSLDADSITVEKGATKALVATVSPATATNKEVTFESSNESVATVNAAGVVTGVASGTATITVKSVSNPEITDTCTVKVPYDTQTFAATMFNDGTAVTSAIAKGETTAMVFGTAFTAGTLGSDGKYADFPLVTKQDWGNNTPPLFKTDETHEGSPVQSLSIYDNGNGISLNSYKDGSSVYVGYTAEENGKYDIFAADGNAQIKLVPSLNGGVTVDDLISWGFDKSMYVRITLNGQKIWPADSDGIELKLSGTTSVDFPTLSDVQMYKGDKLRVEFTSVGDVDRRLSANIDFAVQLQDKVAPQKPVTGVAFTEKTASFFMGESYQLSAGVTPADADNKNIRYTSSDTSVAVVDSNGLVTGVSVGTATIYAISCDDETIRDDCTVTVKHSYPAENASGVLMQSVHDVIASEDAAVATPFSFQNGFVAGYTDNNGLYTDFPYALRVSWPGGNTKPVIFTNDSQETGTQAANQMIIVDGDHLTVSSFTANSWVYAGYKAEVDGKYKISGSSALSDIILEIGGCTPDELQSWGQNKPWYVRITKNGEQIWPAGGSAYEMYAIGTNTVAFPELNDIVLYKGDTVRIEVQGPENIDRHVKLKMDYDVKLMETVAVQNPVTGVAFQNSSYDVLEGESLALIATVTPDNADNKNLVYTSSDNDVVTVNSAGVITGHKKGTATVYATSVENGAVVGSCIVNVKKSYPKVNVLDTIWPEMLAAAPNEGEIVSVTQDGSFTAGTLNTEGLYLDFPYAMRKGWGTPRCLYLSNDGSATDLEATLQSIRFAEDKALIGSYVDGEWVYLGFTAKENGSYTIDGADDFQNIELATNRCNVTELESYGHNKPAYVRITLNGQQIWPTDGNAFELLMTGVNTVEFPKLTGINMYKGDKLRLEVSLPANIDRHLVVNTDFDIKMEEPISVTKPVTGVKFENAVNTVYQYETLKLTASVLPADANNQNVVYSSSDPSIASVNAAGVVTAYNIGEVTIYATSMEDPSIKGACTVVVKKSYLPQNAVETLWNSALDIAKNEKELKNAQYNDSFVAGIVDGDAYVEFPYVLRQSWGSPRAVLYTANSDEDGSTVSKQYISIYSNMAVAGSYVDGQSVYVGYKAKDNGVYKISPAEGFANITMSIANNYTVEDLQKWQEDKPTYVRITVNGEKIWPTDSDAFMLLPSGDMSVAFPTIEGIKLYKGDLVCLEVSGQAGVNRHTSVNFSFNMQKQDELAVNVPVTGVAFGETSAVLSQYESRKILASVTPANADNKNVVYTSSNPEIASVNSAGIVTAHQVGTATITATSVENENLKTSCTIVVKKSYLPENAVDDVWNAVLDNVKNEMVSTEFTLNGLFTAGALDADGYSEFPFAIRQNWGNPRAILVTNDEEENGNGGAKQSVAIYENKAIINSYTDNTWVYLGFKAKDNGVYKISPAEGFEDILLQINRYTVDDLIGWGEDKPTYVRITLNGNQIWPAGNEGYMLLPSGERSVAFPTIQGINMYKGDELRFEVSGQSGVNRHTNVRVNFNVQKQDELAVTVPVTGIKFQNSAYEMAQYERKAVIASVLPETANNKNVIYKSSDEKIATVNSSGVVTAKMPGVVTITATSVENEKYSATCTVTIKKAYLPENVVEELWTEILDTAKDEMKLERFINKGSFVSGVLDNDGIYNDFAFALRQNWGNPRAGVLTNTASENGSMASTQYLSIYENKANIASYVNDQWVYLGFKAPHNGYYTISAAEGFENIELKISGKYTLADLKEWGEDTKPTYVRITLNGKQIWPEGTEGYKLTAAGPSSVAFPTIEGVKMYKGDKLRLEVSGQDGVNRHTSIITNFDVKLTDEFSSSVPVSGITLTDSAVELSINQVYGLKAAVSPANADNKNIRYESSNTDIAVVDSLGRITALAAGNATIYAISEDNESAKAACAVTVTNFKIMDYTPDELKADMDSQLNGAEVVTTKEVEYNQNWTPQYTLDGKTWNTIGTLNTSIYDSNKAGDLSAYSFKWTNKDSIGLEKYYGKYQPFLSTEDTTVALAFTATLAGTYTISGDERSPLIHVPATYLNGRVEKEDENKEWTFAIYLNDKVIYSAGVSVKNNSFTFPTIEGVKMNAKDTLRFALIDNPDAKSQMALYFYPKVSIVNPDKTEYAPIVDSKLHILEPNTVYNGKLGAIHPNGLDIKYQVMDKGVGELVVDENGKITYTPKKDWKGVDTFRIKCSDERGLFSIATVTFMVSVKFDSVKDMSEICISKDENKTAKAVPLTWEKYGWKYQYTYDGLTYTNGTPQYMDTNTVIVDVNPGWWGYTMYSAGMPQATIQAVDGTAAISVMAGHEPWGLNPVGAVSFIAPYNATYVLKGNDLFNKFKLAVDPEDENYQKPIKVWITKNGEKIWPADADYLEISKEQIEIEFPELTVAMSQGDSLRVCVSGHVDNWRHNRVNVAPVVYDIGEYNAALDPHAEPEAGYVITDDDGEEMVKYSSVSYDSRHIKLLKNNFAEPVVGRGLTKNGITSIKHIDKFTCEVSYKATSGASQYRVLVYRVTDDGYELVYDEISDALSAEIRGLDEGKHIVQVVALDHLGQNLEIYTAREFSVGADGKISASAFISIWVVLPVAAGILAAAAAVLFIIFKRKRAGASAATVVEQVETPNAQDETDA